MSLKGGVYPKGYIYGCIPSVVYSQTSGDFVTVSAGAARDSLDLMDIVVSDALSIDPTIRGINGIDTGTFQTSTIYAVYIIADLVGMLQPAAVISRNFSQPRYPIVNGRDYNTCRFIGAVASSDGSDEEIKFVLQRVIGNGNYRRVFYNTSLAETNLDPSSTGFNTVATLDLSNVVPPIDCAVNCIMTVLGNGSSNRCVQGAMESDNLNLNPDIFSYDLMFSMSNNNSIMQALGSKNFNLPVNLGTNLGETIAIVNYSTTPVLVGSTVINVTFTIKGYEYSI